MPETEPGSHVVVPCENKRNSLPDNSATETSQTPTTPSNPRGVASIQQLVNESAQALGETSRERLRRHLYKLARAANTSFAEKALQQEQIRFLHHVNNEAKRRRSTRSVVLGKAKVMSYEDLEEARAKRASKRGHTPTGQGGRGQHPKGETLATSAADPTCPVKTWFRFKAPMARMI